MAMAVRMMMTLTAITTVVQVVPNKPHQIIDHPREPPKHTHTHVTLFTSTKGVLQKGDCDKHVEIGCGVAAPAYCLPD